MKITDVTTARMAVQATLTRERKAPAAAPPLAGAPAPTSEAALSRPVEVVNHALAKADEHLQFRVHKESGSVVVRLIDNTTDTVLREFPSEKFLDLVADLKKLAGLNVDETI